MECLECGAILLTKTKDGTYVMLSNVETVMKHKVELLQPKHQVYYAILVNMFYESSCYRFYSSEMSWTQAQAECQKEKAYLASVPNVWIKTFIGVLQKDNFAFIGGSRPAGSNPNIGWEWLDNTAWSYQNWNTGEPSHAVELCLSQYGSSLANKWNDVDCSTSYGLYGSYGYVCQKHWSA